MRSSLRIAVIFLVTVMLFTAALPVIPVSADSESTGYWELTGTEVEGDGQQWFDGWNKSEYKYTVSAQPGRYIYTWVCNEDYYSASGILLNNKGDTSTVVCTNSQPPATIQGGETVSIDVVVQGHYEKRMFDNLKDPGDYQDGGSMDICAIYESGGYSYFDFGGDSTTLYTSWEEPTAQRVFKCEIRNGSSEGDILNIRACAIKGAMCHYKYIWHDTSSVVSEAATESKVDSSSESDHTAETEDDSMWLNVVIDTSAPDSAGEDSGVVIDEEIVEGKRKWHKDKDDSGSKAAAADLAISHTATHSVLLIVDKSDYTFRQVPVLPKIEFLPPEGASGEELEYAQDRLAALGLSHEFTGEKDGIVSIRISCKKGWLEPPARLFMTMKAEAVYGDETYRCEKQVLLRSQPLRDKGTDYYSIDQDVCDKLLSYRFFIEDYYLTGEEDLGAEYEVIKQMLDGYDYAYGYDPILFATIQSNIYFFNYQAKKAQLRARMNYEYDLQRTIEATDVFWMHAIKSLGLAKEEMTGGVSGFFIRLGLGVATGGLTEAMFLVIDETAGMENYMENTLISEWETGGIIKAGAKPVAWTLISGAVVYVGAGALSVLGEGSLQEIGMLLKDGVKSGYNALPKSIKYFTDGTAKNMRAFAEKVNSYDPRNKLWAKKAAENEMKAIKNTVSSEVDGLLAKAKAMPLTEAQQAERLIIEAAKKQAGEAVEGFKFVSEQILKDPHLGKLPDVASMVKYVEKLRLDPTQARLADKLAGKLNSLKSAYCNIAENNFSITEIKNLGLSKTQIKAGTSLPNEYRRLYNGVRQDMVLKYADDGIVNSASRYSACKPDDIKIIGATNNKISDSLKGITAAQDIDRAVAQVKMGKAPVYYNQAETNQIIAPNIAKAHLSDYAGRGGEVSSLTRAQEICEQFKASSVSTSHKEFLHNFEKFNKGGAISDYSAAHNQNVLKYKTFAELNKGESQLEGLLSNTAKCSDIMKNCKDYLAGKGPLDADTIEAIKAVEHMDCGNYQLDKAKGMLNRKNIQAMANGAENQFSFNDEVLVELSTRCKKGLIDHVEMELALKLKGMNYREAANSMLNKAVDINRACRGG